MKTSVEAMSKFVDMAQRREFSPDFWAALSASRPMSDVSPVRRSAIAWVLGIPQESLRITSLKVKEQPRITVCFVCRGLVPIEVFGYRALRTIAAKWERLFASFSINHNGSEGNRYKEIYKYTHRSRIGGGLIRQERCPRITGRARLPILKKLYECRSNGERA